MKYFSNSSVNPPGLLQKIVAIVVMVALVGLGLMFSAVLFAVILVAGATAWVYLWWKTRELRKQMQAQMQNFQPPGAAMEREVFQGEVFEGEVIEGEATRVDEPGDGVRH